MDQGLISPTFYLQLLRQHIPKEQKRLSSHQCLFALLGSASAKAVCKTLVKLTPGVDLTHTLSAAFMPADPKRTKKNSSVSFCAFGICLYKSCAKNVDEIDRPLDSDTIEERGGTWELA